MSGPGVGVDVNDVVGRLYREETVDKVVVGLNERGHIRAACAEQSGRNNQKSQHQGRDSFCVHNNTLSFPKDTSIIHLSLLYCQ